MSGDQASPSSPRSSQADSPPFESDSPDVAGRIWIEELSAEEFRLRVERSDVAVDRIQKLTSLKTDGETVPLPIVAENKGPPASIVLAISPTPGHVGMTLRSDQTGGAPWVVSLRRIDINHGA